MLWCAIIFQKARTAIWVQEWHTVEWFPAVLPSAWQLCDCSCHQLLSEERQLLSAPAITTSFPNSNWFQWQKLLLFSLISEAVTLSFHFCSQPERPNCHWQALRDMAGWWMAAQGWKQPNTNPTLVIPDNQQNEIKQLKDQRSLPICRLVISTVAFLFTLESRPRQNRSEFDGSVKPSTVREGWDAWKVSPTLWFNS